MFEGYYNFGDNLFFWPGFANGFCDHFSSFYNLVQSILISSLSIFSSRVWEFYFESLRFFSRLYLQFGKRIKFSKALKFLFNSEFLKYCKFSQFSQISQDNQCIHKLILSEMDCSGLAWSYKKQLYTVIVWTFISGQSVVRAPRTFSSTSHWLTEGARRNLPRKQRPENKSWPFSSTQRGCSSRELRSEK